MEQQTPISSPVGKDAAEVPRTRRSFFFFGALAGAAFLSRPAAAQAVGRGRTAAPKKSGPVYQTRVVNESVPALPDWVNTNARLARRITMGATATEIARVTQLGYQQYLSRQLHPESIDDTAVDAAVAARWPLVSQSSDQIYAMNSFTLESQLQEATIYRAAFSERQLFERIVEFWGDHFPIAFPRITSRSLATLR